MRRPLFAVVVACALGCAPSSGPGAGDSGSTDGSAADGGPGPLPSCTDGAMNGAETGVDCGGSCPGCDDGSACRTPADCTSRSCTSGTCAAASCTDAIQNGTESDVDCGGSDCDACAVCRYCMTNEDCGSRLCQDSLCMPTIQIDSAVYAANCGAPTPVPTIPAACNHQQTCDYSFNYVTDLGFDPAYGCMKDLRVMYSCTGGAMPREYYESCAPCDPMNTPTMISLALECAECLGVGMPPI